MLGDVIGMKAGPLIRLSELQPFLVLLPERDFGAVHVIENSEFHALSFLCSQPVTYCSCFTPDSRTICSQRIASARTTSANSVALSEEGSTKFASSLCLEDASSVIARTCALSVSTISFGVPRGANSANQVVATKPGNPCSSKVGTSGRYGTRLL